MPAGFGYSHKNREWLEIDFATASPLPKQLKAGQNFPIFQSGTCHRQGHQTVSSVAVGGR